MTDEQLEAGIEAIQTMLEARAGDSAKVIEGTAETVALPAPDVVPDSKATKQSHGGGGHRDWPAGEQAEAQVPSLPRE